MAAERSGAELDAAEEQRRRAARRAKLSNLVRPPYPWQAGGNLMYTFTLGAASAQADGSVGGGGAADLPLRRSARNVR